MLSDDEVMRIVRDSLARELEPLRPPADLLDRVRDQARERQAGRRRRHWAPKRSEFVVAALSVLVVAAVCAAALGLLSGSHPPSRVVATPGSGLRALVSKLGVFRSPQTAAARDYNAQIADRFKGRRGGPLSELIPRLTRAVPASDGATVFLYVTRYHLTTSAARLTQSGPVVYGLGAAERTAGGGDGGSCCLTADRLSRPRGPAIDNGYVPGHHETFYYEVVPDNVAQVRWEFPRQPTYAGGGIVHQFRHALTVTVTVHDNVAAIRIPQRGAPAHETWVAADGNVLATVTLRSGAAQPTEGNLVAAIKAQDEAIRESTTHGLPGLEITSVAHASQLAAELQPSSRPHARKLIGELRYLNIQLDRAAVLVSGKTASTPAQRQSRDDWVAGTQQLATGMMQLTAGLSDILGRRPASTYIALGRAP